MARQRGTDLGLDDDALARAGRLDRAVVGVLFVAEEDA
jgi:hypothetical protein